MVLIDFFLSQLSSPFKPQDKNEYSPYCSLYISYGTTKENLSKYQDISSLLTTFFISSLDCLNKY